MHSTAWWATRAPQLSLPRPRRAASASLRRLCAAALSAALLLTTLAPSAHAEGDLALGAEHSCLRTTEGRVACWGLNSRGQLGDGTFTHRDRPVWVQGLRDTVAISVGATHGCAVMPIGQVVCWGSNNEAQLGDGTTRDRWRPAAVLDLSDAVEVVAGVEQTCALRRGGRVVCWGRTHHRADDPPGVRRVRHAGLHDSKHHRPNPVPGLDDATELAVGLLFACALRAGGEVVCWGNDRHRAAGDGSASAHALPVSVRGVDGAVEVKAGWDQACARLESGRVVCWGEGTPPPASPSPARIEQAPSVASAVALVNDVAGLACGGRQCCARRVGGEVVCWRGKEPPWPIAGLPEPAVGLGVGGWPDPNKEGHACAVLRSGRVMCWGDNGYGQLGRADREARQLPSQVLALPGPPDDTTRASSAKASPKAALRVQAVALGMSHTCAIAQDGRTLCWGDNREGELGLGVARDPPGSPRARLVPALDGATLLAAAGGHACALDHNARVLCWGSNGQSELGLPSSISVPRPTPVEGLGAPLQQLELGYQRSCVLERSGRALCWGNNRRGLLGTGADDYVLPRPSRVALPSDTVELSLGAGHACARRQDGRVVCWGANDSGQLGNGKGGCTRGEARCRRCARPRHCPSQPQPGPVLGLNDAVALAAGGHHTCALRADATVACWGKNSTGQIGDGTNQRRETPTPVAGLSDVTQIAVGGDATCARQRSGRLHCWGENIFGQVGDRTNAARYMPTEVHGLTDARFVALGHGHTCAIRDNNELLCWGYNSNGQVGDGTEETRYAPVPVPDPEHRTPR